MGVALETAPIYLIHPIGIELHHQMTCFMSTLLKQKTNYDM